MKPQWQSFKARSWTMAKWTATTFLNTTCIALLQLRSFFQRCRLLVIDWKTGKIHVPTNGEQELHAQLTTTRHNLDSLHLWPANQRWTGKVKSFAANAPKKAMFWTRTQLLCVKVGSAARATNVESQGGRLAERINDLHTKRIAVATVTPWLFRQPLIFVGLLFVAVSVSKSRPSLLHVTAKTESTAANLTARSQGRYLDSDDRKRVAEGRLPIKTEVGCRMAGLDVESLGVVAKALRMQIRLNNDSVLMDDDILFEMIDDALLSASTQSKYFSAEYVREHGGSKGLFVRALRGKLNDVSNYSYF